MKNMITTTDDCNILLDDLMNSLESLEKNSINLDLIEFVDVTDDKKYYALQYVDHIINKITNHGIYKSEEYAIDAIHAWWDLNNFVPGYTRKWSTDGTTTIDYGLHHQFYRIVKIDKYNFSDVISTTEITD